MKFMTVTQIWEKMGCDTPYCPTDDWTCPYYHRDTGRCIMEVEEGVSPYDECEAFYDLEEEEEEDDNY